MQNRDLKVKLLRTIFGYYDASVIKRGLSSPFLFVPQIRYLTYKIMIEVSLKPCYNTYMIDDRVRYYFALLENDTLIKHGQMLHEESWRWMQTKTTEQKTSIRFYSKDDYDKYVKEKETK